MSKAKTCLGTLCKRGHDHEGTGKSLRRVRNVGSAQRGKLSSCVECEKLNRKPQVLSEEQRAKYNASARARHAADPNRGRSQAIERARARVIKDHPPETAPLRLALYELESLLCKVEWDRSSRGDTPVRYGRPHNRCKCGELKPRTKGARYCVACSSSLRENRKERRSGKRSQMDKHTGSDGRDPVRTAAALVGRDQRGAGAR